MRPNRDGLDGRSSKRRRFPAAASYTVYSGKGKAPRSVTVDVVWETPTRYKIKARERMRAGTSPTDRWLEAGETTLVPKLSVLFLEREP